MTLLHYPWDPVAAKPAKPEKPTAKSRRAGGRRPGSSARGSEPNWLASAATAGAGGGMLGLTGPDQVVVTDWLFNRLTVSGPDAIVEKFATAAAGAGVVPWRLDFAAIEEDLFHRLVTGCSRTRLSLDGCRAFAAQFREKIETRQARALALVGTSRACPFDLHALLPVPDRVLSRGPEDPQATDWLLGHWGTPALRQAVVLPAPPGRSYLPPGHRAWRIGFFAADWSPWAALRQLRTTWPELRLDLQPVYQLD